MEITIKGILFNINTDKNVSLVATEEKSGYLRMKLNIDFGYKAEPDKVTINWKYPAFNIISAWNANRGAYQGIAPDWAPVCTKSRSAFSAPILSFYGADGNNSLTVFLTDVMTPLEISGGVIEETGELDCKITLFTERVSAMSNYETELILDMRNVPYYESIRGASRVWGECGYKSAYVPDAAMSPMYSTWYSYHQKLDRKTVTDELRIAKEYGMETVIVDDGWQTLDSERGYAYCGDWKPERIPDIKEFVEDVHKLGMKFMMWYSVPFVGRYSEAWNRFSDKFLNRMNKSLQCCTLDPRYPEVRDYLADIYEKAVLEWKLDGLKLDFIDSFALTEHSAAPNSEMDYESLEEAVCALLSEVKERLVRINPDILIEFRQKYMGPVMRTYGNMIRVEDCPMSSVTNRVGSINLRMTSGESAVHSDMLMWHYQDSAESAALQIINVLFCVPQISVLIEKLPEAHRKMLKFYLDFWNTHRDCLMYGDLTADNPEANYSLVRASNDSKLIAASYSTEILDINKAYDELYFINGSWKDELVIRNNAEGYCAEITVYDCMGNVTDSFESVLEHGFNAFKTPKSGIVAVKLLRKTHL